MGTRQKQRVNYHPVTMGGNRTEENQALLLAKRAFRVWDLWCKRDDNGELTSEVMGIDEEFDNAVRALYRSVHQTDVYFSGKHVGRKEALSE